MKNFIQQNAFENVICTCKMFPIMLFGTQWVRNKGQSCGFSAHSKVSHVPVVTLKTHGYKGCISQEAPRII